MRMEYIRNTYAFRMAASFAPAETAALSRGGRAPGLSSVNRAGSGRFSGLSTGYPQTFQPFDPQEIFMLQCYFLERRGRRCNGFITATGRKT